MPSAVSRLNSLLGDDGYLDEIVVGPNSIRVPLLLDLYGERVSVVLSFVGVEEFSFVGGLTNGMIEHPELVDGGVSVFSTGAVVVDNNEIHLVLSWEGERSLVRRAHSMQVEFDRL
jgi:hypothetical protein